MVDPDTEVLPGQILAGKYRIEEVLGKGGMGVVVAATHVQLQERVALKFLLPEALSNDEAVRRFEREARAAVKIKSEHVARVTDVGVLDTGSPYMVMEYLSGLDLGQYVDRHGPLDAPESAEYILQACEAIAEAHSLGIVHRDLKPANLFRIMRADGTPSIKVLDFGISKLVAEGSMTQTSSMMGSPYYMSPEQMTSAKTVDARTDVWALGVILHELLTGRVPYQGDTIPEICVQILQAPPPRLTALRPDLPASLERIIEKALAKDREGRFSDIAAFAAALAPFAPATGHLSAQRISRVLGVAGTLSRRADHATPDVPGAGAPGLDPGAETTLAGAANTQTEFARAKKRSASKGVVLAAVALLLGAGGVALLARGNGQEAAAAAAEAARVAQAEREAEQARADAARAEAEREAAEARAEAERAAAERAEAERAAAERAAAERAAAAAEEAAKAAARDEKPPAPRIVPRPTRAPVANPTPRPSPAPTPAPRPRGHQDLFLDRK